MMLTVVHVNRGSGQNRFTGHPSAAAATSVLQLLNHIAIPSSIPTASSFSEICHSQGSECIRTVPAPRVRRRGNVSHAQSHGKNASIRVRPAGNKDIVLPGLGQAYTRRDLALDFLLSPIYDLGFEFLSSLSDRDSKELCNIVWE